MTTARLFAPLILLTAAALPALAAKPNFTGDWTLNIAKSDFGQMPAPTSSTSNITHNDPKLEDHSIQIAEGAERKVDAVYSTDGTLSTNQFMGNDVSSTVKWEGDVLTFDTKGKFGDTDFTLKDKWTLSDDAKTFTVSRVITSSMGEMSQSLVWEKK